MRLEQYFKLLAPLLEAQLALRNFVLFLVLSMAKILERVVGLHFSSNPIFLISMH